MRTLIAAAFSLISLFSVAQSSALMVEGTAPNLYLSHTVAPKESYYSLARMFNVPPAVLATSNGSNLQTGLKIGQTIKIPLTAQNFNQEDKKEANETLVPVYHVVAKNETLFRIGNNYNKVPLTAVKAWNSLSGDNLSAGTPLIVGHLKIKNDQLPLFNGATTAPMPAATPSTPAATKESAPTTIEEKRPESTNAVPVAEPKKPAITSAQAPVEKREDTAEVVMEIAGKVVEPAAPKTVASTTPDLLTPTTAPVSDEGFFAPAYASDVTDKKITDNSGDAATFKSVSGWQNKKYYALMNNVEPGTIVKITAAEKSVYAKVLGSLPDTKENTSLLLRVSNAAASYLGKVDPKFPVQVSFYR